MDRWIGGVGGWMGECVWVSGPCMADSIHATTHPPIGGRVSTDHKCSNRIELSSLAQDLFNC